MWEQGRVWGPWSPSAASRGSGLGRAGAATFRALHLMGSTVSGAQGASVLGRACWHVAARGSRLCRRPWMSIGARWPRALSGSLQSGFWLFFRRPALGAATPPPERVLDRRPHPAVSYAEGQGGDGRRWVQLRWGLSKRAPSATSPGRAPQVLRDAASTPHPPAGSGGGAGSPQRH